jgi:hypothetical protein
VKKPAQLTAPQQGAIRRAAAAIYAAGEAHTADEAFDWAARQTVKQLLAWDYAGIAARIDFDPTTGQPLETNRDS